MFIAIEGLDGVGKSTVAKGIARVLDISLLLISPPGKIMRELTDRSLEVHFLFYLFSIYQLGKRIVDSGYSAVSDCYLLRAISAHEAMDVNRTVIAAMMPLIRRVYKPDVNFLLICEHNKRIERLETRNKSIDQFDITALNVEQKVLDSYKEWSRLLHWDLFPVDTNFREPDDVVETIIQSMK